MKECEVFSAEFGRPKQQIYVFMTFIALHKTSLTSSSGGSKNIDARRWLKLGEKRTTRKKSERSVLRVELGQINKLRDKGHDGCGAGLQNQTRERT